MEMIRIVNGKLAFCEPSGSVKRTAANSNGDLVSARWEGENIICETVKGKTELRNKNGSLIRTL